MKRLSFAAFVFISFFLTAFPAGTFAEELASKETIREDLDRYYESYRELMRHKAEPGGSHGDELRYPNDRGHFDRLFGVDDALRKGLGEERVADYIIMKRAEIQRIKALGDNAEHIAYRFRF